MQMTDIEIRTSFRQAKDKHQQINVLAELNACTAEKIKGIVGPETERDYSQMQKLYESGLTDLAIGSLVGMHATSVWQWRKKNNLVSKHKIVAPYDELEIRELYDQGLNDVQIGLKLGIPNDKVMRWRHINRLKPSFKKGRALL